MHVRMSEAELVKAEIKLQLNNKHLVTHRGMHEGNVTNLADTSVWKKTFQ